MAVVDETLTVVIPVYNEGDIIELVLKDWHSVLSSLGIDFIIKCYDDGSKDNSWEVMRETSKSLSCLEVYHKPNSGHGPTILQGYRESYNSTWIFQVDSDDEISAKEFIKLWQRRDSYDLILGKRTKNRTPFARKIISLISRMVISTLFGAKVSDVNSPFRLMRVECLLGYLNQIPLNTFAPNLLVTGVAALKKLRYLEVPVQYQFRQTGKVSIRKIKLLRVSLRALGETLLFWLRRTTSIDSNESTDSCDES